MRWSGPVLTKLAMVRNVRMTLAEAAVGREERALEAALVRERHTHEALTQERERSESVAEQANAALVARSAGGRSAITQWKLDRGQARRMVADAQVAVDDAETACQHQRDRCAETRQRWRELRFDVERLQALIDKAAAQQGGR